MPKTPKPAKIENKSRSFYTVHPWECRHHKNHSEIIAYIEASSNWEVVAEINPTAGVSAETMASFICNLINDNQRNKSLLHAAMEALELCLEDSGLTFSSEQTADSVLSRIKKRIS